MITESKIGGATVGHSLAPGRPLVLLTRMASRGMGIWDSIWPALAERFSVASFDLTPPPVDRLQRCDGYFAEQARIAADVASALGHERFAVIGWNGGTHLALRCAHDFPERVAALVLLSPFYELDDMRSVRKGLEIMQAMMAADSRELYAFYWFMSGLSDRFVAENFDRIAGWAKARAERDPFVRTDLERMTAWAAAIRRNWLSDAALRSIGVPALVLAPTLDKWSAGPTVRMAEELAKRLPAARLETLDGLGSLALYEAPERFLAAAVPFLVRHAAPRARP